jgi:hypothetical protein
MLHGQLRQKWRSNDEILQLLQCIWNTRKNVGKNEQKSKKAKKQKELKEIL